MEAEGLRKIVVRAGADGRVLRLKDVADVRDRWADDPARNYVNGRPGVVVTVSSTVSEDILFICGCNAEVHGGFQRTQRHGEGHADQRCDHGAASNVSPCSWRTASKVSFW